MDLKEYLEDKGLYRRYCGYVWLLNEEITPDSMYALTDAFTWDETEEGYEFWAVVDNEYNITQEKE